MDSESTQLSNNVKQVIVIRRDLNCRRGKEASQVAHASMAFLTRRLVDITHHGIGATHGLVLHTVEQWWLDDSYTKIVASVDSEEELLAIRDEAMKAEVECHLVQDNGLTEFGGIKTYTCLALGPDLARKIDPITGHLKLR